MSVIHNNTLEMARERVLKARTELIVTAPFYAVALGQVVPVMSDKVETAATNGKQHFWNPNFVNGLKRNHLGKEVPVGRLVLGVQVHENEHDVRRHHSRRNGRDPFKWNVACDYSLNCDVIDAGYDLPEGALIDRKYKGMSAEDVYRCREIDEALQKQKEEEEKQQQQEQDDDNGDDDTCPSHEDTQGDWDDGDDEPDADGDDAQDDESSDGEAGGDAGDEDGSPEGNSTGSASGNSEGEPSTEGAGEGEGEGDAGLPSTPGTATGEPGNEAGEPDFRGDCGGCGEVLDAAQDTGELASEDARWETVLRQAEMLAAKRGNMPGHVARLIEHADHPPQDWRETLRAFFDAGATVLETWSRPNRRFVGSGLYLPGKQRDGINRAVVLIDTSGSVTYYPGALEAIKVETQAALDEGFIDELIVVYGDTRVTRVDTYRAGDEIEFDPKGGGGTIMKPLFDYVRNEIDGASCIIAFTDMEIEPEHKLGEEPACPVLWAAVGYPDRVKEYLKRTPWGAPGIEVVPSYN